MDPQYLPVQDVRVGDTVVLGIMPQVINRIVVGADQIALVYRPDWSDSEPRYWQCRPDAEILMVSRADEPAMALPSLQRP